MTYRECAIVEAYTGICMLTGNNVKYEYRYLEELLGRPVQTYELANKKMQEIITNKSKPDFIKLCQTAVEGDDWPDE